MATGTIGALSRAEQQRPLIRRHGSTEPRGLLDVRRDCQQLPTDAARFGRMFPNLAARPDVAPTPIQLGAAGSPMDGGTQLAENPRIPAGFTYFGQFLDHDITLDITSSLDQQNDPAALRNFRTPSFELDSVYGAGPDLSPCLYDAANPGKLLLGPDADQQLVYDLPRNAQGTALIGDPRNDENLIIAQLHLAFLKFHNAVLEGDAQGNFEQAQRTCRWHYQWIVINEFLPLICGDKIVDDVFNKGRQFYRTQHHPPYMPVEFSVAAYRFGHSMARPQERVNDALGEVDLFPPDAAEPADPIGARNDLRGGPIAESHQVEWRNFFDLGKGEKRSLRIDTKLAGPLINLPQSVIPGDVPIERRSLAVRNLQRSFALGLPSGQDVACCMGVDPLDDKELWDDSSFRGSPAPLWYYILREAEKREDGKRLGDVGARIVAEVFHGLLDADPSSFLNVNAKWKPHLGLARKEFEMTDLLRVAGVAS